MRPAGLVTVHQPQYLPYVGLLAKIDAADTCVFFDTADYQKGYFDNRNRVLTKNGPAWLTVPVHCESRAAIRDTRISGMFWVRKHLQTLQQAYGKAPFFEPYFSEFRDLLQSREFQSIGDLAEASTYWLLRSFGIQTACTRASLLIDAGSKASPCARLIDLVRKSAGNAYLAGPSWKDYLSGGDVTSFNKADLKFYAADISEVSYAGHNGSYPNLSAVDLLFSLGSEGVKVIRSSIHIREVTDG